MEKKNGFIFIFLKFLKFIFEVNDKMAITPKWEIIIWKKKRICDKYFYIFIINAVQLILNKNIP